MLALADVADHFGRGEIRLTVWQNLIIPGIPDDQLQSALTAIHATGLDHRNHNLTGGLIACTGSRGCKYAAADTKGDAITLGKHLAARMILDQPVNIHLTGCQHSCAQHYIGDIGMMGTRVKIADGSTVDGYNIVLGGGVDDQQGIAREIWKSVKVDEVPGLVERLLCAYLAERAEGESFASFTRRLSIDQLQGLVTDRAAA
jgi:ferredoxin-nitrite reductase